MSGYQHYKLEGPTEGAIADLAYPGWMYLRVLVEGERWDVEFGSRRYAPAERSIIYGPASRAARIVQAVPSRSVVAGFTPLGWARLFSVPAHEVANRLTPAAVMFGDDADRLSTTLAAARNFDEAFEALDALLLPRLAGTAEPERDIVRLHELIMSDNIIEAHDLASRLDLSTRQMARISLRVFGFAPKLLLRRRRFLKALQTLEADERRRWSDLEALGYYDQSQFIHDFKQFIGMTPSAFFSAPRPLMQASHQARRAELGSGIGGLQGPIPVGSAAMSG